MENNSSNEKVFSLFDFKEKINEELLKSNELNEIQDKTYKRRDEIVDAINILSLQMDQAADNAKSEIVNIKLKNYIVNVLAIITMALLASVPGFVIGFIVILISAINASIKRDKQSRYLMGLQSQMDSLQEDYGNVIDEIEKNNVDIENTLNRVHNCYVELTEMLESINSTELEDNIQKVVSSKKKDKKKKKSKKKSK